MSSALKPRLCHVKKWPDFQGYGFNLHAEKGKAGQFIGGVDHNSPASFAGLKQGDRIIECNGTNIANENHQQVVTRIKAVPNETKLLVVDEATDNYYRKKNIVITSDLPEVVYGVSPDQDPSKSAALHNGNSGLHERHARFCIVKKWHDFEGYGFNLHAEKGKPGQFIGKVDSGSPAEYAGLKQHDRIVEVNQVNIENKSHQEVVQHIKENSMQVKMLLVDHETDEHFKRMGVTPTWSDSTTQKIECPDSNPNSSGVAAASTNNAGDPGSVRLCILVKWPTFKGYGFNLHAEKGKPGQYIGSVDNSSPGECAGLKMKDKIVEVNGDNVTGMSHQDVVQRITQNPNTVSLLVMDPTAETYYRQMGTLPTASSPGVQTIRCPESSPAESNGQVAHVEVNHSEQEEEAVEAVTDALDQQSLSDHEDEISKASSSDIQEYAPAAAAAADDAVSKSSSEPFVHEPEPEREPSFAEPEDIPVAAVATFAEDDEKSVSSEEQPPREPTPEPIREPTPEPVREPTPEPPREPTPEPEPMIAAAPVKTAAPSPPPASVSPVPSNTSSGGGSLGRPTPKDDLPFTTSLEEARARAARGRKKHEVKQSSMNMKDKYALFQQL